MDVSSELMRNIFDVVMCRQITTKIYKFSTDLITGSCQKTTACFIITSVRRKSPGNYVENITSLCMGAELGFNADIWY